MKKIRKTGKMIGVVMVFCLLTGSVVYGEDSTADQIYTITLGDMDLFSNNSVGGSMSEYTDTRDKFFVDNYGNEYSHSFYVGCGSVTYLTNYMYDTLSGTVAFPKEGAYDDFRTDATLTVYGDGEVLQVFEGFNNLSTPEPFSLNIANYERIKLEWKCTGMNIWADWGYYATIFDGEFSSTKLALSEEDSGEAADDSWDEDGGYDSSDYDGSWEEDYGSGCDDSWEEDYGSDYDDSWPDESSYDDGSNHDSGIIYVGPGSQESGYGSIWYYISDDYEEGIAVRAEATAESGLLCRLPYGTEFYVDWADGDWGHTNVNGCDGWINLNYASPMECGTTDDLWIEDDSSDESGCWYSVTYEYDEGIAVRAKQSTESELLCRLAYGTAFHVDWVEGNWAHTAVNGREGWIHTDYVSRMEDMGAVESDSEIFSVFGSGIWYEITSDYKPGIAVRAEPSENSTLLCRIPKGTEFEVQAFCGVWGFTTVNGYTGWVHTDYTETF